MSSGSIVEIIGAVVDVEFPRDTVPKIYDALKIEGTATTLEVQGQLGDGVVRTIAMGSSERSMKQVRLERMRDLRFTVLLQVMPSKRAPRSCLKPVLK